MIQTQALYDDLEYIANERKGFVYILGHHPDIVPLLIPAKYSYIVKGKFAGHVHYARDTDVNLFTQVIIISI